LELPVEQITIQPPSPPKELTEFPKESSEEPTEAIEINPEPTPDVEDEEMIDFNERPSEQLQT